MINKLKAKLLTNTAEDSLAIAKSGIIGSCAIPKMIRVVFKKRIYLLSSSDVSVCIPEFIMFNQLIGISL